MDKEKIITVLQSKIDIIPSLKGSMSASAEFKDWDASVKAILRRLNKNYYESYKNIRFFPSVYTLNSGDEIFINACSSGLDSASSLLKSIIEELNIFGIQENVSQENVKAENNTVVAMTPSNLNINISMSQQQTQSIRKKIDLSQYDQETKEKVEELLLELSKKEKNKKKIQKTTLWLADKAIDIIIAIMLQAK